MIVVSNTSPLNYLIITNRIDILRDMFGKVVAPPAVIAELSRPASPEAVRLWIASRPAWLQTIAPQATNFGLSVDAGEMEAIALAEELGADRILLDDAKARRVALSRGLKVAGTLAILFEAAERGLIDFRTAIDELRQTTFYLDERLIAELNRRMVDRKP